MARGKSKSASAPVSISSDERRWRAESDARTLMSYAELQSDKSRLASARAQLRQQQKQITKAMGRTRGR